MSITRKLNVDGHTVLLVGDTQQRLDQMETELYVSTRRSHVVKNDAINVKSTPAPVIRVMAPVMPEDAIKYREAVCNNGPCPHFIGGFSRAQYRCTLKQGCNKLGISFPSSKCLMGKWPIT